MVLTFFLSLPSCAFLLRVWACLDYWLCFLIHTYLLWNWWKFLPAYTRCWKPLPGLLSYLILRIHLSCYHNVSLLLSYYTFLKWIWEDVELNALASYHCGAKLLLSSLCLFFNNIPGRRKHLKLLSLMLSLYWYLYKWKKKYLWSTKNVQSAVLSDLKLYREIKILTFKCLGGGTDISIIHCVFFIFYLSLFSKVLRETRRGRSSFLFFFFQLLTLYWSLIY